MKNQRIIILSLLLILGTLPTINAQLINVEGNTQYVQLPNGGTPYGGQQDFILRLTRNNYSGGPSSGGGTSPVSSFESPQLRLKTISPFNQVYEWDFNVKRSNVLQVKPLSGQGIVNINKLSIDEGTKAMPLGAKLAIFDATNDVFTVYENGSVYATEVTVTVPTSFPDYVFEDDYNLMSLTEVESYIEKNKHLPNIPTAKEVEEKGLSVGSMQVKQMEKIEELFLHMIEMEKELKGLKSENQQLKAEVELLKASK